MSLSSTELSLGNAASFGAEVTLSNGSFVFFDATAEGAYHTNYMYTFDADFSKTAKYEITFPSGDAGFLLRYPLGYQIADNEVLFTYEAVNDENHTVNYFDVFSLDGNIIDDSAFENKSYFYDTDKVYKLVGGETLGVVSYPANKSNDIYGEFFNLYDSSGSLVAENIGFSEASPESAPSASAVSLSASQFGLIWSSFDTSDWQKPRRIEYQLYGTDGVAQGGVQTLALKNPVSVIGSSSFDGGTRFALLAATAPGTHYPQSLSTHQFAEFDVSGNALLKFAIPFETVGGDTIVGDSITKLANGELLLSWTEQSYAVGNHGIFFQLFSSTGKAEGAVQSVYIFGDAGGTSGIVTPLANGGFLLSWYQYSYDYNANGFMQRVYDANGDAASNAASVLDGAPPLDPYGRSLVSILNIDSLSDGGWRYFFSDGTVKTFHLSDVNNAPVVHDNYIKDFENMTRPFGAAFDFAYYDADGDQASKLIIESLPDRGRLTLNGQTVTVGEEIDWSELGKLAFTAVKNEYGDHYTHFGYKVETADGAVSDDTANEFIKVVHINNNPTGHGVTIAMREDSTFTFSAKTLGIHDVEGDIGTISVDFSPGLKNRLHKLGTFYYNGKPMGTTGGWLTVADLDKLQFVTNKDAFNPHLKAFSFYLADKEGGTSRTYHGVIDVEEVTDKVVGTASDDVFRQSKGTFKIYGLDGNDVFNTGALNDTFIGGAGRDTFVMKPLSGADTVNDFDHSMSGNDVIDVRAFHVTESFADFIRDHVSERDGNAVITFTDGASTSSLTLHQTTTADLKAEFFVF